MPLADAITGAEFVEIIQNGQNKKALLSDIATLLEPSDSAYDVAVQNGFVGSAAQWLASLQGLVGQDGIDGKSAYDLAVDAGAVGTELEWLASLQGETGAAGVAGTQGPTGPTGNTGPVGPTGKSPYDIAVFNGFVGNQEQWLQTLKGEQGLPGDNGLNGSNGTNGANGVSAYQVAVNNGFVGTQNEWIASLQGFQGITGAEGPQGKNAYQLAVEAGYSGGQDSWLETLKGDTGETGATGPAGEDGNHGLSAYEVAVEAGYSGTRNAWLTSLIGPQGPIGLTGLTGATGAQGIQGAQGLIGLTGPAGIQGSAGITGAQGPQGVQGPTGPVGVTGATGAVGKSAFQSATDDGFVGNVSTWLASLKGTDGLNAYEIAVDNGFVGDVTAWILSLKGQTGATGAAGATGATGSQGLQGPAGPAGGLSDTNKASLIEAKAGTDNTKYMTALAVFTAIAEKTGTVYIPPGSGMIAKWTAANDALRNAGGGVIELKGGGAAYVFDDVPASNAPTATGGIIIDVGAGVGIKGNGAVLDFRPLEALNPTSYTDGIIGMKLSSRARTVDNFPIPGYDGAASNYHGTRAILTGFSMIGGGRTSIVDAMDADQADSTARSPRPGVRDVVIQGFRRGFRHRKHAYFVSLQRTAIFNCGTCLSLEGSSDGTDDESGENSLIDHCALFSSDVLVDFNTGTNDFAVTFRNVTFDNSIALLKLTSGYGRAHFYECHWKHSGTGTGYPIDFTAGTGSSSSRAHFRIDGGVFSFNSATGSANYPSYMGLGQNVRVQLSGSPTLQGLDSSGGFVLAAGKGVAGVDVKTSYFARCTHASAAFEIQDGSLQFPQFANASIPAMISNSLKSCLIGDPAFEQSFVADAWTDISTVAGTTTPAPGTTMGALVVTTADSLTGTKSLGVPFIGGASGLFNRRLSLLVPIEKLRGRNFSFQFYTKFLPGATSAIKGGGNVGNGVLTLDVNSPTLSGVKAGVYLVRLLSAVTNGGVFTVTNPDGVNLGNVSVGTVFSNQIKFVIADGSTDFVANDGFNITVTAPTGGGTFDIVPVVARKTGATSWVVDAEGSVMAGSSAVISGVDWAVKYLNSQSARLSCPEWATHINFRFNLDGVNNDKGKMLIDEFWPTVY